MRNKLNQQIHSVSLDSKRNWHLRFYANVTLKLGPMSTVHSLKII